MGRGNFSDEFKRDAVAQIAERGYPVAEVSQRLSTRSYRHARTDAFSLWADFAADLTA